MNSASLLIKPRKRGWLFALLAVLMLAVVALMSYLIWSGYREAIRTAETTSRNYAAIIEARLDATLRRADSDLQNLEKKLPVAALSKQAVPRYSSTINADLDSYLIRFVELTGFRVFAADGDLLYASNISAIARINVADRRGFFEHRDNAKSGLVFSEVLKSRATGRLSVTVSRGLRDRQGKFLGVVAAVIELDQFKTLFQSLDIGPQGLISLFRSDDFRLVVRWPEEGGEINKPLPPGSPAQRVLATGKKTATFEIRASTDGIVRTFSMHALKLYPFYVTVGLAREDVLAGWKERTLTVGLSSLLLLGLLSLLLSRLWRAEVHEERMLREIGDHIEAERRIAAENLRTERRLSSLMEIAPDAIVAADTGHRITVFNKSAEKIFGYSSAEILGRPLGDLMPSHLAVNHRKHVEFFAQGSVTARDMGNRNTTLLGLRKDGSEFPIEVSISVLKEDTGSTYFAIVRDITEKKLAAEELEYRATHDSLTGLPNRNLFMDRLLHALAMAEREEKLAALMILDLDGFKQANDTLGHSGGDELLRAVASRLQECVRRSDTVARLGGDEFAVILEQIEHIDVVSSLAQKIVDQIRQPFQLAQGEAIVSASIGITLCPLDGKTVKELMVDADRAMYAAKAAGKNCFKFYSAERANRLSQSA